MTDKIFDFIIQAVRNDERKAREDWESEKPKHYGHFFVDREAGDLVAPCKKQAEHHRGREKHYTTKLEEAEKELREKGVTVEVFDQSTGTYQNFSNNLASGAVGGGVSQNFQPRVDQRLADNVKNMKAKMLEHRDRAVQYEKQSRAFALNPRFKVRLTVEDVHYFRLEG